MKVVFAGTPAFAATALQAIATAGHEIALVLTQPDRPAGRGMKMQPSEVKRWALDHGVGILQPAGLRLDGRYATEAKETQAALLALAPDVMVVAAYGLILPQWVLDLPRYGCLNIHASLLPRWRGAAPIHRAIEAGDAQTGVTLMQMDAGLDTGDMLMHEAVNISALDTTASLHDKLASLGGALVVRALQACADHQLRPVAQPGSGVTYAHKIEKAEAWLDFGLDAQTLARRVRAFNPFPGAALRTADPAEVIKVWQAEPLDGVPNAQPGAVLAATDQGLDVACASGVLRCTVLQRAGGKRLGVREFLQGYPWRASRVEAALL
jgi:methionyl-tRNA formyltransferase